MNKRKRLEPHVRKQQILDAAIILSRSNGYSQMQRDQVAKAAGCAEATVTSYFGTMHKLKIEVLKVSLKNNILPIIGQAVANKEKYVLKRINEEIKKQALNALL